MSYNPVIHFEMGYFDNERIKKFYEGAFGWKLHQMGPEMGNYITAQTTETDENRMVKTPGTINGGFYKRQIIRCLMLRLSLFPCRILRL